MRQFIQFQLLKVKQNKLKTAVYALLFAFISLAVAIFFSNNFILNKSSAYLFDAPNSIPTNNVGLVLGTSNAMSNGTPNLYFTYRINAAAQLFHAGKVKHLLVSGDNHIKNYNEPEQMRLALIAKGVPDSCITLDYAGFRTLDSVIRCRKVFGQSSFTIISQRFHNTRAVFIARQHGLNAVGYNAKDVKVYGIRNSVREPLARFKAILDVYIFNKKPKFLGEPVKINT